MKSYPQNPYRSQTILHIDPVKYHYEFEDQETSLRFDFAADKDWLSLLQVAFFGFWIFLAALFLLTSIINSSFDLSILLPVLLLLTFTLAWFISALWLFIGKEVVEIQADEVLIRHEVKGISISQKRFQKVDAIYFSRYQDSWFRDNGLESYTRGKIALNNGKKLLRVPRTYRFGGSLPTEEAEKVVALIHQRFPQYLYHPPQAK